MYALISSFSEHALYFTYARSLFPATVKLRDIEAYDGEKHWGTFWFADATVRGLSSIVKACYMDGNLEKIEANGASNYCRKHPPPMCGHWQDTGATRAGAPSICPFPFYTAYHQHKIDGTGEERRWRAVADLLEKKDREWWEANSNKTNTPWGFDMAREYA